MPDQLGVVRAFVQRHVGETPVDDDEDIFASGYVNSLFAVQVVMFVEQTFGIEVTGDDLDIRNFQSIAEIHRFVLNRGGERLAV
jgi:methoxymalonate biosynthesis acyl carrier protein